LSAEFSSGSVEYTQKQNSSNPEGVAAAISAKCKLLMSLQNRALSGQDKPTLGTPVTTECTVNSAAFNQGAGSLARSLPSGNFIAEIPESSDGAYRRLVLNAPSLLPSCEMPVARLLFAEWLAEQEAEKGHS
jgi:hypothetical protein